MRIEKFQRLVYEREELKLASPFGPGLWLNAYERKNDETLNLRLIVAYLVGLTLTDCWSLVMNKDNRHQFEALADWFIEAVRHVQLSVLSEALTGQTYRLHECAENVPQLSSFEASTLGILDLLATAEGPLTYTKIGYQLLQRMPGRSVVAQKKYGENAAKFAAVLGLVEIGRGFVPEESNYMGVRLTAIGQAVQRARGDRNEIIARLLLKSALFRDLVCTSLNKHVETFSSVVGELSESTQMRRASAFSAMLDVYRQYGGVLPNARLTERLICAMRH